MGYIIEGYKLMGQEIADKVMKNRANILTGLNVVGTIATAYISHKDTEKSTKRMQEAGKNPYEMGLKEKVQECWKDYIPTALSVVGTSAAGIGSNRVSAKDLAEMTALYTGTKKLFDSYKQASKEVLGEKKQQEVTAKVAEEHRKEITPERIARAPHFEQGDENGQLFSLDECRLEFYSTKDRVDKAFLQARLEMAQLRPRSVNIGTLGSGDYKEKRVGISMHRILNLLGFGDDVADCPIFNNMGFNKGFELNGADDDEIGYELCPGEALDGEHTCWSIEFTKEPSDMRTGWEIKKNLYDNT